MISLPVDMQKLHETALIKIENAIIKRILSNVPPPNAPSTAQRKGSSKTLVDTGEMVGHVTHRSTQTEEGLAGEVGILDENVSIRAIVNEYGTGDGRIPARPFLRPAFDETAPKAAEEMADELFKQIEQKLGW